MITMMDDLMSFELIIAEIDDQSVLRVWLIKSKRSVYIMK
jgi:hypothetical protein